MRIIKDSNEVIDLIVSMRGGGKVSVGYISSAKMPKTTKNVDWNDLETNKQDYTNNEKFYNDVQTLKDIKPTKAKYADLGYKGIVKVSQFTTNWQTTPNYIKNRNNLEKAREDFLTDHGVPQSNIDAVRRPSHETEEEYGKNGVLIDKTTNKISFYLNPSTKTNASYSYYLIDESGDASNPMSYEGAKRFIAQTPQRDDLMSVFNGLQNMDEVKYWYHEFCKAMKYKYRKYSLDNVLYLVGTIDGEPFFFFNDKLINQVDYSDKNLIINPESFKKIAYEKAKKLQLDMSWVNNIEESKTIDIKKVIKLTESDLHLLIETAVKEVINEMGDRSEYWKQRWAKQKEEGNVPDRSKYWKERARKQKAERLKKQKEEKQQQSKNKRIDKATKDWEWLQWHRRTFGDPDPEWEGDYSYGDFYPGDN